MYLARSFFIRSGNVALVAVLNDGAAGEFAFESTLRRITGPLITPQVHEVLAAFAHANIHLRSRPAFATVPARDGLVIEGKLPESVDIDCESPPRFGEVLAQLSARYISGSTPEEREQILDEFRRGERSYLFDAQGVFVDYRARLSSQRP